MLIVLNVPLISLFVQILRLPGSILAPLIIVFCVIGAYTLSNNVVEVIIMIAFGIGGFLMRKADLDPAPLVLAFVLGNILETNFRQALLVGKGTLSLFYTRPIAAALICLQRRVDCGASRPRDGGEAQCGWPVTTSVKRPDERSTASGSSRPRSVPGRAAGGGRRSVRPARCRWRRPGRPCCRRRASCRRYRRPRRCRASDRARAGSSTDC